MSLLFFLKISACSLDGYGMLVSQPSNSKPMGLVASNLATHKYNEDQRGRVDWINKNKPNLKDISRITEYLNETAYCYRELADGAKVYSVKLVGRPEEVNLCFSNCFNDSPPNEVRQSIFFPNGVNVSSWSHEGTIL